MMTRLMSIRLTAFRVQRAGPIVECASRGGKALTARHNAPMHIEGERAVANEDGSRIRVRRFDADRHDEVLDLEDALGTAPSERQLLWIDVMGPIPDGLVERLTEAFGLDDATAGALDRSIREPILSVHGSYIHVTVIAEPDPRRPRDSAWLTAVAAPNAVVTYHHGPIGFLDDLDERVESDTAYGLLDSLSFLATLLHVTVTSYFAAVDGIEEDIEQLDDLSLRDRRQKDLLEDLVEVRGRIAVLRRLLAGHRFVYAGLEGIALAEPGDVNEKVAEGAGGRRGALLGGDDRRRERPRPRAGLVQRLLDPGRAAHERHDEGPDAGHRAAAAGLADRRAARDERRRAARQGRPAGLLGRARRRRRARHRHHRGRPAPPLAVAPGKPSAGVTADPGPLQPRFSCVRGRGTRWRGPGLFIDSPSPPAQSTKESLGVPAPIARR